MADPIDPELLAQLQKQGYLQGYPGAVPVGAPYVDKSGPSSGFARPGGAPPVASSGSAPAAPAPGVPVDVGTAPPTQSAVTPMKLEAPKAEGIFDEKPVSDSELQAPQWHPTAGRATPGGWKPTQSEGTIKGLDSAYGRAEDAPLETAKALGAQGEHAASLYDIQAEKLGALMAQQDAQRKERSKALDAQVGDYKRLQDESAADKVDPNHWWGSKNVGEKALGIIGIILGGLSQGQGHGNPAIDLMNKMVDNDIAAQKANIEQKGKKAAAASNLYSMKLKQFGDEDAADAATRAQMQEQFKLQLLAEAQRTGSPVLMAQAKEKAAEISLMQAKEHKSLEAWQKGGSAGGISPEDSKRAMDFMKSGMTDPKTGAPITADQAIQLAMSLRGAAPTAGTPTLQKAGAGGKKGVEKHDLAAAELTESGSRPLESLGAWDRVTSAASHIPIAGTLFQGTEGARKEKAIEASNLPVLGYVHAGLGIRSYEDIKHAGAPLLIQPSDSQARINQKLALRGLAGKNMKQAIAEGKKLGIDVAGAFPEHAGSDEE